LEGCYSKMKHGYLVFLPLFITLMALTACIANTTISSSEPVSHLRIITEEFPPFNYTYQDGNITGQSTAIIHEILKRTHTQASIEVMPWSQGYELVQKKAGTLLYSTSRIPDRENLFKWVGPIGTEDNYFYTRLDSSIQVKSLEEAKKTGSIAIYRNDSNHLYLAGQGFTNLDISENDGECLKKLLNGQVDMWLGPEKALYFIALKAQVNQTTVKPIMFVRSIDWYIAFNKSISNEVVQNWQSTLDEMKQKDASGSSLYEQITHSYTIPKYVTSSVPREKVVNLVEKTSGEIAQDAVGTFRRINNGEHPYLDKDNSDLYVFIYDADLFLPANADNPAVVGRSYKGVPDAMGNLFRDRIAERSLLEGTGWQDYVYTKPGQTGLFNKEAYFQRISGSDGKEYIVCAGRYKLQGE
jgi:polar amino acid transport system substrate-binding protein